MPLYSKLLLLYIFFTATSFAQQGMELPARINWSETLKEPNNSYLSKIIYQDSKGFYVLREQRSNSLIDNTPLKIYVEYYNNDLKLKRVEKIDLKYKNKTRQFEDVIKLGDHLYLLSSFHNRKHKVNYLFAQKISRQLKLSSKFIKIGEIPTKNINRDGSFDYHISQDSSTFLIYNQLPYKKGEPERFIFNVYNTQFEKLWQKTVILPYNDENFEVEEYQVDNNGNVYLMGVIYINNNRRRSKQAYQYTILAYTEQGEKLKEYKIDLEDKLISDLTFRVANDGDLVCSGFYSEQNSYSIKGTYFFRLNAQTQEIYNKNYKAFDIDFLTYYMSDRQKSKAHKAEMEGNTQRQAELYRYNLDELILRTDGGALLIAEQYFIEEQYSNMLNPTALNNGTTTTNYYYHYNDIIVVNIRPNGAIEWTARIPKSQKTKNDNGYYSSYAHAVVRDKIYFVYNDNRRNFDKQENAKRRYNFNGRNSIIALSELHKDGSVNTYPLYNNRDADIISRPKICKQSGRKEMLLYGEIGRRFRFAKLYFK